MIRNRIDALVKEGTVRKYTIKKEVFVTPTHIQHFPYKDWQTTPENIESYFSWRFPRREQSTHPTIQKFTDELIGLGYNSISYLDDIIVKQIDRFLDYENQYFSEESHKSVGAARSCIGLSDPKLGKNGASSFYILNYDKFISTENEINSMGGKSE